MPDPLFFCLNNRKIQAIIKEIDFNIDTNRAKNRYGLVRELDDNDEKPDFEIEK